MADKSEIKPVDDSEDEVDLNYKPPEKKSVQELQELDQDDESLTKYKRALLGNLPTAVDPNAPNVQVIRMELMCTEAPAPIKMELAGNVGTLKDHTYVLKEASSYRVKITFKVNKEIVSGLRYVQHTYKTGIKVDKETHMVGSYGPRVEPYEFLTPLEEAPKGMLARGTYSIKSFFTDDDKTDHLSWEWKLNAPWCGHCQELAPKYSQAAEALKNQTSEARLAKVDATEEKELGDEFGVKGYPTILFFKDGNRTSRIDFGGRRDTDGIIKWMLRRMESSTITIETAAEAEEFIKSHEYSVIAFFQDPEDADVKLFYEVATTAEDFTFAITHKEELLQKYGVTADTVIFFTKDGEKYEYKLDEDLGLDKDELFRFLMANSMGLVTEYNEQTSERIFAAKIPNHLLLFINKTEESQLQLLENFRGAAAEFKGKILFVSIDSSGPHAGVLEYFGLQNSDIPTIRFINIDLVKKYAFKAEKITTEAVREFCQGVLDGKIKQNLMSEDLPEDWDKKPVKVLVGTNFEDIAYDENKNVFVEFYAPWCTHCKELEPIWEELGEKYKDHPNVIIAKIDGTANEIDGLRVRGYPNLRFFPAGPGRKMIEYTKNRTVELFSKFIDSGGVLPMDEEEKIIENLKDDQRGGDIKVEDVPPEKPKEEL